MSSILIPASTITQNDEPQNFGETIPRKFLPAAKNYAEDPKVVEQIQEEVVPVIDYCRTSRTELEAEWRAIQNMEMLAHDESRRYLGRSEAYMPLWSRILATRSSALAKGIFPSDEYLDCVEQKGGSTEAARAAKAYVQWELERNGRIRNVIKPFLRQLESYGNSPLKFMYNKAARYEGRSVKKTIGSQATAEPTFKKIQYDGLHLSCRSIFNWYIYPHTADSIEEATLVFEDIDLPMSQLEALGRQAETPWVNIDKALNGTESPYRASKKAEEHAHYGLPTGNEPDTKVGRVRSIQEVWTFLVLPRDAYLNDEDPECPIPVVIHMVNDYWILSVQRNPFFHQRPPYRFQRYNTTPGVIYGYGTGKLIRHLQYQANDFMNQTNDCGNYILNPIVKRNPAMMAGPTRSIRPGVVWDVTDTDAAIKFDRPPHELVQVGLQMVAMILNNGQDFTGAPPQLSGMKSGGVNTATGMQILQKNAASPIQDQVEEIEQETMLPLLYGAWRLGQQFRDKTTMFAIAGQHFQMDPVAFAIDAQFRMLSSSQAVNSQQRAQMAIQFIQGVMPLVPLLMQQGYIVDPAPVLRRLYSDGLGFRGFDEFIKKATGPMVMGQDGQMMPGQGMQQEQGDRMRSALENLGGQYMSDAAPGEAEAFQDVRSEADQMAATAGSTYGTGG